MKESAIQAAILRDANSRVGCHAFKAQSSGIGRNGIADIVGCYHSRFFAIEVKQPGESPTRLQQYELDQFEAAGAAVCVAHSLAEARAFMDGLNSNSRTSA